MGPIAEIVDTWLPEDRLLPRKDRRNAATIFKKLQRVRENRKTPARQRMGTCTSDSCRAYPGFRLQEIR